MATTKTISTLERARDAFDEIKDALELKIGQSLDDIPVENYDNVIGNIPSGGSVNLTNLAYMFYYGVRNPKTYWASIVEPNMANVISFIQMCKYATLESGTYNLDISGLASELAASGCFGNTTIKGTINLILKIGEYINSLSGIMNFVPDTNDYNNDCVNFSFDANSDFTGFESLASAFKGIFGTINLSSLSGIELTSMSSAFDGCNVFDNISGLGGLDVSEVEDFSYAFNAFNQELYTLSVASLFDTIDISGWNMSSAKDLIRMFGGTDLKHVKFNPSSPIHNAKLNYSFFGSSNLIDITGLQIQDSGAVVVTQWDPFDSQTNTFADCSNLERITSPGAWTLQNGGMYMFNDDVKLESVPEINIIVIAPTYQGKDNNDYVYMFGGCSSLEYVTINAQYYDPTAYACMDGMFSGCSSLKEVRGELGLLRSLGDSEYPFYGCTSLEKIYFTGVLGDAIDSNVTLDLSDSAVFDIDHFLTNISANTTSYDRSIKLHHTVYSNLSASAIAEASQKNYLLVDAGNI